MTAAVWPLIALLLGGGDSAPEPSLVPGAIVEGELGGGESQTWRAELAEPGAWNLVAEQRGVDLALEVFSPAGELLIGVDSPLDRRGVETLLFETAVPVSIQVRLRGLETGAPAGGFQLTVERLAVERLAGERLAGERLAGERASTAAGRRYFEGTLEGRRAATEHYREALAAWRELGAVREQARALTCLAVLERLLGELPAALAHAEEALAAWRGLGVPAEEANLLGEIGLVRWQTGDVAAARAAFSASLELQRRLGEGFGAATAAANLCLMELVADRLRAGLACYREALPLLAAVGAPRLEAAALVNLGRVSDLLGDPQQALESYRRAQELQRLAGDHKGEAQTLNNLGVLSRQLGDTEAALASYAQALAIFRELGAGVWQARVLNNIGNAYRGLGQLEPARAYFDQALALWRAAGNQADEAATLDNLGQVASQAGDPLGAIALHRQALELRRAAGAPRGEALTLQSLARAQLAAGETAAARAALDRALELMRSVGERASEAELLRQRGELLLAGGDDGAARGDFERSLETARALGQRANEAAALVDLARAEQRRGGLEDARAHAAEAVAIVETLRTRFANPDLRTALSAVWHDAHELLIDVLMALHRAAPAAGWERAALEAAERARARTLLELLQEAGAAIETGADPALLERRRGLELRLAARAERALDRRPASAEDRAADTAEASTLRYELDVVETEIRRQSPRFAALSQPGPLTAAEIHASLDAETLLLVLSLGEARSFAWVIDTGSIEVFELPPRATLETAARTVHERLAAFDPAARGADQAAAAALARWLLAPVVPRLGDRRLAVVADGALYYVPFGALPLPATGELLVARHEVVELASASALAIQRQTLAMREPAGKWLAVVADPVFDARDPRVEAVAAGGGGGFERLVASRREAGALAALAPAGQVLEVLDFEASRERLLGAVLAGYRVVHFATHGVIDAVNPAFSGLVLSRVDAQGRSQPGFLGLRDVYDLRLDAELVVLSGCRTALGEEVRGEGLIGLVRGFLFAGARRVVASLWPVEDQATAELMVRFYRAMETRELRPAAALRAAQLEIRAERRWRDPHFWAGFVLVGDWR